MSTLDVLVIIPAPSDGPAFDVERAWQDLARAAQPLVAGGALALQRLQPATEAALRRTLAEGRFGAMHFIGCGSARSAQYGTLAFEDSASRSRNVNANPLAALLKQHSPLALVVLQGCQDGDDPLGTIADMLVAGGVPAVVATPRFDREAGAAFVEAFYGALLAGQAGEDAVKAARDALVRSQHAAPGLRLRAIAGWRLKTEPAVEQPRREDTAPRAPRAEPAQPSAAERADAARAAAEQRIAQDIARKRAAGEFDVFMCHNGADKPAVKKIAQRLMASGVVPWLDEWELPPGRPWQPLLEQQVAKIRSAAVFVGAAGVGPWQEQELYGFLREFVSRQNPVIPVLLENAPDKPALPIFLKAMTWVDFRLSDPDPLERLIWGITGRRAPP